MKNSDSKNTYDPLYFFGYSEAGKAAREVNWSQHPLGIPEEWSVSLKTTLSILFNARQAMFLFWGKENFGFYNDAQIPILGNARHQHVMGKTGLEIWPDVWEEFALPQINIAKMGQSTWSEDQLIPILRSSQMDDGYFSYGYSPVYVEDGRVGGAIVTCTETTGKVLAERNLKENEERLKITLANVSEAEQKVVDVLESMGDGFIALDKDFKVLRVNKNQEQISGLDRSQTVGKNHWDIWPKESIPKIWEAYHKVIAERVPVRIEDFNSALNIWIAVDAFPTPNNGIAAFFNDITERKTQERGLLVERQKLVEAKRQLKFESHKLEMIFNESPAAMALWQGHDFVFEKVNPQYQAIFPDRELVGKPFLEACPEFVGMPFIGYLKNVLETGKPYIGIEEYAPLRPKKDGPLEDRYYDFSYHRIDDAEGKPYGVYDHAIDVTERVKARKQLEQSDEQVRNALESAEINEANLRGFFMQAPLPLCIVTGSEHRFMLANQHYEDFVGRKVEGKTVLEAFNKEQVARFLPVIDNVYQNGIPFIGKELPMDFPQADGSVRNTWIDVTYQPYRAGDGKIQGIMALLQDVTEHVEARNKIVAAKMDAELARVEAERANKLKSAFLANMSHEIRTPLGAMIGFADLIADFEITSEERKQFAQTLKRNGEQLTLLIDDILDLSKVEAGHLKVEVLEFSLRSLIEEVLSFMKLKAQEKGLRLTLKVDANIDDKLISDPTRLRQILLNVAGNAVKFTQAGEVAFSIVHNDGLLELEIHDTGMGIAPEHQTHLFKPFVQGDESMTRKFGGTGLGLALSKRLAQLLGGDLTLKESTVGKGSTFKLVIRNRLPIVEGKKMNASAIKKSILEAELALNGLSILLVEDSPDNQLLISRLLTKKGAKVEIAENGLEGVEKALNGKHDLVLMDVQMPVLDGYSATQRLREAGFRKPIIALTAHAMSDAREKCLNVGYSDFLPKPVNVNNLMNTVAKYALSELAE